MKSIRIGAGLGFYGDNWEPVVASIQRGGVQFIASDHLAELTLAILQKDRQRDPALGYARDVVPMLLRLWPLMRERGVRFVCNAGGLNPMGAAQAVLAAFVAKGWPASIAVVSGDDVLPRLLDASTPPMNWPTCSPANRLHRCVSGWCSATPTWARRPSCRRWTRAQTS